MSKYRNHLPFMIMLLLLLASRFLRSGTENLQEWLIDRLCLLPGLIVGLSFHEFAHAFVSDRLGDPTPRSQGRVTVDPLAHIDPTGLICLIIGGFGWGKPVQIDPRYYRHRRLGEALTAVAGVTMNLLLAVVFMIIFRLFFLRGAMYGPGDSALSRALFTILNYAVIINLSLLVFNLLPLPPLDGFNLLTQIFDLRRYGWWSRLYGYGPMILIILILFGVTGRVLTPCVNFIFRLLASLIF